MARLPLKGWPRDVIRSLAGKIDRYVRRPFVDEFYIGRTNDLVATKSRHGCDAIFRMYETRSADNAIEVEDALVRLFCNHRKCSNDAAHGGGGASDEYTCFVYLAVWFAARYRERALAEIKK